MQPEWWQQKYAWQPMMQAWWYEAASDGIQHWRDLVMWMQDRHHAYLPEDPVHAAKVVAMWLSQTTHEHLDYIPGLGAGYTAEDLENAWQELCQEWGLRHHQGQQQAYRKGAAERLTEAQLHSAWTHLLTHQTPATAHEAARVLSEITGHPDRVMHNPESWQELISALGWSGPLEQWGPSLIDIGWLISAGHLPVPDPPQ